MGRDSNPCPSDLETKIMTSQLTHILSFPRSFLFLFHFLFILFLSSSLFSSSSVPIYLILISLSVVQKCFLLLPSPPPPLSPFSLLCHFFDGKETFSVCSERMSCQCRRRRHRSNIDINNINNGGSNRNKNRTELESYRAKARNCFSISCHRGKTSCFCGTLEGTSGL